MFSTQTSLRGALRSSREPHDDDDGDGHGNNASKINGQDEYDQKYGGPHRISPTNNWAPKRVSDAAEKDFISWKALRSGYK